MLSIYIPFVSTGFNPNACIGDSIYEWVVNTTSKTLTRIYKETYVRTNTIDIQAANCTHITMGTNANVNYIFTSSGAINGNIYRINSIGDTLPLTTIQLTKTDTNTNVCCSAIAYKNGYLWVVPSAASGITGTIIRLNIFSDLTKTSYTYTDGSTQPEVTVCNISGFNSASATVSTMYIFGNYVFTLKNSGGSLITKISTLISETTGYVIPTTYTYTYSGTTISSIASDNINNIWMSEYSTGMIYCMSIENNNTFSQSSPTNGTNGVTSSFSSTLIPVSAIKYGAGYLWIAGTTVTTGIPSLVQVDVKNNTIITTIPLITTTSPGVINPTSSTITSIDIYNEYMWLTDSANSALLKMKIYIPCFMEGTKILCLNAQMKEEYIPIENIRKGHLVKTSLNGFVPVCMIGHSVISNPGVNDRIKNRLYKCTKDNYPELFEDLYITGCHSILVDKLSDSQLKKTMDELGDVFITDRKYRLMAYLDDRSEPYTETGTYNIWHLALENNDYLMNYGIYANGLLVESTSKRYMKELSGMKLVE